MERNRKGGLSGLQSAVLANLFCLNVNVDNVYPGAIICSLQTILRKKRDSKKLKICVCSELVFKYKSAKL